MISATLIGNKAAHDKLVAVYPSVRDDLVQSINKLSIKLVSKIKTEYLSGQVLHRRTGRLSRSVHANPVAVSEGSITGKVGTNVSYAAFHEYGFQGTESIKSHLRTITQAFGRQLKGGSKEVTVHAYTRQVDYPARSFMRAALHAMQDEIETTMQKSINGVLK